LDDKLQGPEVEGGKRIISASRGKFQTGGAAN